MARKPYGQLTAHGPFRIAAYDEDNSYQITFCHANSEGDDLSITLFLNDKDTFDAMLEGFDTTQAIDYGQV